MSFGLYPDPIGTRNSAGTNFSLRLSFGPHRSSRLRIFPVALIGSASRNSMILGYLKAAICSRHQAIRSSAVIAAPGRRTTTALTSSLIVGRARR